MLDKRENRVERVTVYATFSIEDTLDNGQSNGREVVLVQRRPFPYFAEGVLTFKVARIVIAYEDLFADLDDGLDIPDAFYPSEAEMEEWLLNKVEVPYSSIIPYSAFIAEENGWYGSYIKSLDVALEIEWSTERTFVY